MLATILSLSLPILQSIIAARIDSTLNDWVKSDDSAEDGRFYHIMKVAFVKAVRRIKGDNPKIIKDNVDALFEECRELVLEEIRSREPAHVMSYIQVELYKAFKKNLKTVARRYFILIKRYWRRFSAKQTSMDLSSKASIRIR